MYQNPYTINLLLGNPNRAGLCIVYLNFYSSKKYIRIPTSVRISPKQWDGKKVKSHVNAKELNNTIKQFRKDINDRAETATGRITKEYLMGGSGSVDSVVSFFDEYIVLMKGKLSSGRLKRYEVVKRRVIAFDKDVSFSEINLLWLQKFEAHIRPGLAANTINSNMKVVIAILNRASELGKVDKKQFELYRPPSYVDNIPVYLTEGQINAFYKVVASSGNNQIQKAGYYFLLSCYAGYRIGDLMSFKYSDRIIDRSIVLRAKKNGNIVSIPIFPKLGEILEYCKDHPLSMSEKDMRERVKEIAKMAGIKADVKVRSARHSFAMLMLDKGLNIDEVAELLGDSKDVAKRYARITNKHLHKRVMEVMGG